MIEIRARLASLNKYASELSRSQTRSDKTKEEALKALSQLEKSLKDINLDVASWNEIYETIKPFNSLDLSVKETGALGGLLATIGSVFTKTITPKERVKNLLTFVDQKRFESINNQHNLEQAHAKAEFLTWIGSQKKALLPSDVLESIQNRRAKNPRSVLSLKEEFTVCQEALKEKIKELEKSGSSSAATQLENFTRLLEATQKEVFAFQRLIQRSAENQGPFEVTILQPVFNDFDQPALEKLRTQRLFRLQNLNKVYQQSVGDPNQQVASKCFSPVCAWYVGSTREEKSNLELEMQGIGKTYGIKTIADRRVDEDSKSFEITENYKADFLLDSQPFFQNLGVSTARSCLGEFPQDFLDFSKNGEIRFPRLKQQGEEKNFYESIAKFRTDRSEEWKELFEDPDIRPTFLGVPFNDDQALKAIALASALKAVPVMNLTYNEGGNTLIGTRASAPYVIIGKDSYDISKKLMEQDLGREMTYDEVCRAFAIDYGVSKENVHFVEQPGDFHLDMSMAIVGENTILLNDAVQAQNLFSEQQNQWLVNMRQEMEANPEFAGKNEFAMQESMEPFRDYRDEEIRQAQVRKKLEDVTASDLEKLGFRVIRVPGRFHFNARQPAMNLFNFVSVKTPNNKNVVVLMGCIDNQFEARFKEILNEYSDQKIDAFHFLNTVSSQECLLHGGGISCRTKLIPE